MLNLGNKEKRRYLIFLQKRGGSMRSIYIITLNNIKKRKLQSFLISLIIMVSCVMFFISLGILTKAKEPFLKMQQKLNASQDIIGYKESFYDINKIKTWWENNEGVKSIQTYKGYSYIGKASYNKSPFRYAVNFTEREEGLVQDKLLIVEGDQKETPGFGEVWVATGIAYQENIKVGGILKVNVNKKDINFKVSAIVVDPQFSTTMVNPTRMWIKGGEVDKIFNDVDNNIISIGVIYKDYSKVTIAGKTKTFLITGVYQAMINEAEGYRAQKAAIIDMDPTFDTKAYSVIFKDKADNSEFINQFTNKYNDISIDKTREVNGKIFNDIGKNISVPILMVGVIFIIISFINIFNIVLINVYEERKNYGIYKALGFTIKQIRLSIINRIMALTAIVFAAVWIPTSKLLGINLRELIEE
jgi:ABC-type antimicrobial peptide transport system permease subunit